MKEVSKELPGEVSGTLSQKRSGEASKKLSGKQPQNLSKSSAAELSRDILVLCDTEEEYAGLMTEFLKARRELPWEIHTYTAVMTLLSQEQGSEIAMLVVAESAYVKEMDALRPRRMIILNESGVLRWDGIRNINKYQEAERVLKSLLEIYVEIADSVLPPLPGDSRTKFIGIYSPVRRCLQTSFALTMSQMLAAEHRTLYLNFEHYAGITELLPDIQTRDMGDMLYFLNAGEDTFRLRMQIIIQRKGDLDYVPPMKSGQNLLTVSPAEWMQLLQKIRELEEYEFVVMDLSESIQGLFDILRSCEKVFTLTGEDRIARSKLLQYEQVLALYQYEDVLDKTCRCNIPHIRKLPQGIEQYTRGELADFVRGQLKEIGEGYG